MNIENPTFIVGYSHPVKAMKSFTVDIKFKTRKAAFPAKSSEHTPILHDACLTYKALDTSAVIN